MGAHALHTRSGGVRDSPAVVRLPSPGAGYPGGTGRQPARPGGTLFVGNHVSHFDIVLLGSLLRARFIAKDDMKRWPGMHAIGELAQTVYISRRRRDAAEVAASVAGQMRPDHDLVLFAEGTTSSGERVAPFKSSLFSLFPGTQAANAWEVQPFTLDVRSVDGRALREGGDRDGYAFYGDMEAGAHVSRFLRLRGTLVRVIFHPPLVLARPVDRKTLAAQVHAIVAGGLEIPAPPRGAVPPAVD